MLDFFFFYGAGQKLMDYNSGLQSFRLRLAEAALVGEGMVSRVRVAFTKVSLRTLAYHFCGPVPNGLRPGTVWESLDYKTFRIF